ncbi:MAG: hypothetical protein HFJ38_04835 [Bacilli bacterium]|nr:hypothetical protein [Bacilli bacterium]
MNIKKENELSEIEKLLALPAGDYYVVPSPPYISQFASRELVSDILDKKIFPYDDPKWKNFGFNSIEDYSFWSQRLCGLICIKMILDTFKPNLSETVATLTQKAINLGGYRVYDELGNFIDKGWYYEPLIELVKEYGLDGNVCSSLTENDLCLNVINNIFSIASVHPGVIRFDMKACPLNKKGGHLVVITGFKWSGKECLGFMIHNPSGRKKSTQENAFIPIEQFRAAFASRGLVIKDSNLDKYIEH